MLPAIRSAFQMIADAAAKIDYASMSGDLVVSAPVGITSRWLIRHIGDFMRQYPEINLKLVPSNEEKEIYSPQVDLCVRYGNGSWRDRRVSLLCSVALFPVSSPMLMNGPHPIRSVRDLRHHVLLCEDEGLEWRRWLLAASSSTAPEFRTSKLGNVHLALEAAIFGHGVALGDSILAKHDLAEGRLVRLFEVTIPGEHAYYTICRHELAETPLVSAFSDWLEEKMRQGEQA
jgi:LysR family glycine cleavage system transcriptional activator